LSYSTYFLRFTTIMAVLENNRHEHFAQAIAKGVRATKAYVLAGYSEKGAQQSSARLLLNAVVCSRVSELRQTLCAGTIALEISSRNARIQALQGRWSTLRAAVAQLMTERAADMAEVPGGGTGLLVRQYQGGAPIYKVDTGLVSLIGQLLAHEKQAAEELGQWTEKRDVSGDATAAQITINLNLGRQRVVEEKKAALARGEIWCE
jgi:hypothetical protein